jgi:hypothetical protein
MEIHEIFEKSYRDLRLTPPIPELRVEFYPFASLNNNIRLREGKLRVRLSDILEGAPEAVLGAIAHILLAKMYRRDIQNAHSTRYRKYVSSQAITRKTHSLRQIRGRKRIESGQGSVYDLDAMFDALNFKYFHGLLARPRIAWSRHISRHRLGHYDPAHHIIVVSRVFDDSRVPAFAVEYIMYHEMLHLKYPVKLRGSRRCVHCADFRAEEKLFLKIAEAKIFLKTL